MNWSKQKIFLSLSGRRRFSALALLLAVGVEGLLLPVPNFAQALIAAFPGAQGAGAAAVGGRGGQAIEVTNLNDSGAGSLRACIEASGPRVCLFRVAGIINVQGDLRIGNPYLTIAGQTAPGGGIKLTGTGAIMWVNTHDVVIRYISYDGNSAQNGPSDGSVSFDAGSGNVYNVVFDHVSGFHVTNKQLIVLANDGGAVHNVTFQWSMTYQPDAAHPVGPMVDATTWPATGVTDIDYHHDFFGDTSHRLPLFNGASGRWVSNLIYNWNQFATLVQGGAKFDAIDNDYVSGPGLGQGQQGCNNHEIEGDLAQSGDDVSHSMPGPPLFWLSGNQGPNGTDWAMTAEVRSEGGCEVANPVENSWRRDGPLPAETFPITADAAATLDTVLLATVGNSQGLNCDGTWNPRRQTEDAAMILEYQNKSQGSLWSAPSGYQTAPVAGGIPCAEDPANHLPTAYEAKAGIGAGTSANAVAADGYTVLENYLNGASSGTVTPPPPPPPPPNTLAIGASVATNTSTNVRATADGTLIEAEPTGTAGTVLAGPSSVSGNPVIWWQVQFADGTTGWVGADELNVSSSTPPPPPPMQPSAPTGGAVAAEVVATATISWTASASSGVTSYNVYRGIVSGGPYTKLTGVNGLSYTDTTVQPAANYFYVITAVAPGDTKPESDFSSEIPIVVP
jgi:hypothetical protein